jgi:DNA polymerase-3 subunit alpha
MSFTHLHNHSHYSLLQALPKIPDLVKKAKEDGMTAIGLTDAGNMYGAIEFYQECLKKEIKPILGVDFYVAARTRHDRESRIDNKRTRLILLAKDFDGYKSLIKLVTRSNMEGFYYKPRIDDELLEAHHNGLVCIMPSFSGTIALALKNDNVEKANEELQKFKKWFGDDFYFEITHHPEIEGHEENMQKLVDFAKETKTPIVAAHDTYYLNEDDKRARETLVSIQNDYTERVSGGDKSDWSFISKEKAEELFKDTPDALENVDKIVEKCNLDLPLGKWLFPNFIVESGRSHNEELRHIVFEGIQKRGLEKTPALLERVEYELSVINDKGYSPYFLVVGDLLREAHEREILTTIRGSVAGSMVTYLAHITNVNPMEYMLPFERFLNPMRPSAPDVDMDYADNRRDEIISYARDKYGHDKVAQIGTFGTMMARGAVRDVARALGYEYSTGDRIAKLIPMGAQGAPMTIDKALALTPELKKMYDDEEDIKEVIDMAKKIEGCARHISVHAAGVVISPIPLDEIVPTQMDPKGEGKIITQYDMHSVDENSAGLLKFDFLGIRNLSILADAVKLVRIQKGIEVDIENVPVDDKKTFEMLARGETMGLFQLNGDGMTKALVELKPSSIHDINVMVALYRPGPMDTIQEYIARKHGKSKTTYYHPKMKKFLERTFGLLVYQDDLLYTAIELAGYDWGTVDKFRKAVGKKIPAEMAKQHVIFVEGCEKFSGISKRDAEKIWDLFEPFQGYGFNKCLTGDTRIVNSETGEISLIKDLYEIKKLIPVMSLNKNSRLESRITEDIVENGIKEVFELKTRTGKKIRATSNHPLLTISGWKLISELESGAKIATPRIIRTNDGKDARDQAGTLGYILSEGNLCHPHGIYFYSTNEAELEDFSRGVMNFSNTSITRDDSKSATALYVGQINQRIGNSLTKWINLLGLKNKKATEKFIPAEVWTWNTDSLSVLLGKMWQGDGAISEKNNQVFYATSSSKLAQDVQHALLRLGILSTIHNKKFKYRDSHKLGYTVVISHRDQLMKFSMTVGVHLIDKKKRDLDEFIANLLLKNIGNHPARGTTDIIPAEVIEIIKDEMKKKGLSTKELSKITGLSERLFGRDAKKIGYQRAVIEKIGKALQSEQLLNLATSDVFWDEIVSITPAGMEMTYDLTVSPYHNFVANDIIVHNSHAASYGKVAYQTAYMKANFPALYMAAALTAESGDTETIGQYITECKRMGIPVLPPDVNESFKGFTVVEQPKAGPEGQLGAREEVIRFGLVTIKNFGEGIADSIIKERQAHGKFVSLEDFLVRIKDRNLNKKSLESLIKAGAMDAFGDRGVLLSNLDHLLTYNKETSALPAHEDTLFGSLSKEDFSAKLVLDGGVEATMDEKLGWEKELLGLYISGHPLDKFKEKFEKSEMNIAKLKEISRPIFLEPLVFPEGTSKDKIKKEKERLKKEKEKMYVVAGMVTAAREIITKTNTRMMFLTLTDLTDSIECIVFSRTYEAMKELFVLDACIAIKGKMNERNGELSLVVEKAKKL